ncbi:substrate-binding periplasmic protein [Algicola sagamiensis]|uniref:substrate-binding periplasmic protein n=1 Tax=Algicola sagamiensis TaxID=163869 RepID=UPI00039BC7C8|nr:transporter substrate-binding domain-containing protein [Algicola sagamiensis]
MKKRSHFMKLWFLSLSIFFLPQQVFAKKSITISTGEYSPWVSKSFIENGYVSHVIKEAFQHEGVQVTFKFLPWKRAYEDAKSGKFDATSFWFVTEERKKDFYYSDPVMSEKTVFFHLKTNQMPNWKQLSDFKGKKIGATIGYTYTPEFWEAQKNRTLSITAVAKDETNFKKMVSGRIDLFPIGSVAGFSLLNKSFGQNVAHLVTFLPKPLVESSGHLLFSKANKSAEKMLATFNTGLKKLKESGKLEEYEMNLISGKYEKK